MRGVRLQASNPAKAGSHRLQNHGLQDSPADPCAGSLERARRGRRAPRRHAGSIQPIRARHRIADGPELRGQAPFLWVDRLDASARQEVYARLKRGDVVIGRLDTQDAGRTIESPRGLIHHWTGTTFIPGATVERTVALMQGYDRYQEHLRAQRAAIPDDRQARRPLHGLPPALHEEGHRRRAQHRE